MSEQAVTRVDSAPGPVDRDVVQSLVRGVTVVRAFDAAHPALTLDQAAERVGISRSAVRRLLRTLMAAGLTTFDGHHYRLTAGLLDLGYAQQSRLTLTQVAEPHCAALSRDLERTVSLARLTGSDVVYLVRVGRPRLVDVAIGVGSRLPAHHPAIGRVQLAWLPEAELEAFLASETFRTRPTRMFPTAAALRETLADIRERGWCEVAEEIAAGVTAVAAPIRDRSGRVVAAINVLTESGVHGGATVLDEVVPAMLHTAADIGTDLHPSHLS
ncbi:IclR family transcriptional regulator C-terminal domain-containing protein [Raineyella sp. LH-20]|uniref:IclR family transcriptional regulator domain-containing protein n=1 Tax=Raineyella sp. LH-20 TaxID=3081204 RepID=UPI002952E50B|nr:IclR family transcriptional regulator C-terminal domain-containing protein [Raineyella sp. LH-20]WOP18874.1 IclR family transcriptional regulator C-terminal domain-containing protein [Raineyella sp. LH-20]